MGKGKRKKAIIFMSVGVVVLAALFAGVSMYHMSVRDPDAGYIDTAFADICSLLAEHVERQLKEANAYLEEMDYVQAVTEFAKAIRVDPENVESYFGMEEAYEGMDDIHMAVQTLDRGYMATGDERFLEEKQKFLIEWEDKEFEAGSLYFLQKTYEREYGTALLEKEKLYIY